MGKMYRLLWTTICLSMVLTQSASAEEYFYPAKIPCIDYNASKLYLEDFNETPLFLGIGVQPWIDSSTGNIGESTYAMTFNVNQDTGTWSMIQVYIDGTSCLMATGTNFTPYTN